MALALISVAGNLKLNNGSSSTGAVRTVNLPLGGSSARKLSATDFSTDESAFATKVLNISRAIAPILTKSVYMTQIVETSQVTN